MPMLLRDAASPACPLFCLTPWRISTVADDTVDTRAVCRRDRGDRYPQ